MVLTDVVDLRFSRYLHINGDGLDVVIGLFHNVLVLELRQVSFLALERGIVQDASLHN